MTLIAVSLAAAFWLDSDTRHGYPQSAEGSGILLARVPPARAVLIIGNFVVCAAGVGICLWASVSTLRRGLWQRQ